MAKGSICLAMLLLSLATLCVHLGAHSPPPLHVRAYNAFGVDREDLVHARETADTIFRAAGLVAVWRECRTPAGPSSGLADRCDDTVSRAELILRIVAAPRFPRSQTQTLGFSHVDPGAGAGTLATVFADRVRATAARARVDPAVLLGRVVAHELGHLLLGSLEHGGDGLMRESWPDPALQAGSPRDWLFSGGEAARLLRAARDRAEGPPLMARGLAFAVQPLSW